MDFDNLVIGKKYIVTGGGVITDKESGVVLGTAPADSQFAFVAIGKGVMLDSEGTILPYEETSSVAVGVTSGGGGGGDTPGGGGGENSDWCGYIEYDDATGAIVDLSVPKYLAGNLTFENEVLPEGFTDWKIDMPYLTDGSGMFNSCTNLTSFTSDLPNLTNGRYMFYKCENLTSWTIDLPNLINGQQMFIDTAIASWNIDLPNLANGYAMFSGCTKLASFTSDLPNLTNGQQMFGSCTKLTSWTIPLPALTNGYGMFMHCTNLTSFSSDLPNLTNGQHMFTNCKLDAASVERILNTIPTYTDGSTHLLYLYFSSEAAAKFEEITGVTPTTSTQTVSYKGWTITAMIYNG